MYNALASLDLGVWAGQIVIWILDNVQNLERRRTGLAVSIRISDTHRIFVNLKYELEMPLQLINFGLLFKINLGSNLFFLMSMCLDLKSFKMYSL